MNAYWIILNASRLSVIVGLAGIAASCSLKYVTAKIGRGFHSRADAAQSYPRVAIATMSNDESSESSSVDEEAHTL